MPRDNDGKEKAAAPPAGGLARGRVERGRKRRSQPPTARVTSPPANPVNSSDGALRAWIAEQSGVQLEDVGIEEPDQELLDAIKAVPAEWDRELLARIAGRLAPQDRGMLHAALNDPGWWGPLLSGLRQAVDFQEWNCDPRAGGTIPPGCAAALREALIEVSAIAVAATLHAATSAQRVGGKARAKELNAGRAEKAERVYAKIRREWDKLSPDLTEAARCNVLRTRHGWSRGTIRRALGKL